MWREFAWFQAIRNDTTEGELMSPEQKDRLMQIEFNLEVIEEELSHEGKPTQDLKSALRAIDRVMRRG